MWPGLAKHVGPRRFGCTLVANSFLLSPPPSNIAEALVSKGLATVIRYRQDDDQRSSHYDELLAAEAR